MFPEVRYLMGYPNTEIPPNFLPGHVPSKNSSSPSLSHVRNSERRESESHPPKTKTIIQKVDRNTVSNIAFPGCCSKSYFYIALNCKYVKFTVGLFIAIIEEVFYLLLFNDRTLYELFFKNFWIQ